jgi:hypothetical protein
LSSLFSLVIFFGPIKLKEREEGPKETREREEIKGPQMPSLISGVPILSLYNLLQQDGTPEHSFSFTWSSPE